MKKLFIFILFLFCYAQMVVAQQRCGTVMPSYEEKKQFIHWLEMQHQTARITSDDTVILKIPLVFHVIHSGEAIGTGTNIAETHIYEQVRILNEDFRRKANTNGFNTHPNGADTRIEFVLAQFDTNQNPTNGIVRINGNKSNWTRDDMNQLSALSYWNSEHYLNIWVCNLETFLGYVPYFPKADLGGLENREADAKTDGIVMNYRYVGQQPNTSPFNSGRTLTHEMGHFLGLFHVWGDGNCDSDDFCEDTPLSGSPNFGCPAHANTCPQSEGNDPIENYLNYTHDTCMNTFTQCQANRMRTVLRFSPRRATLVGSPALDSNYVPPIIPLKITAFYEVAAEQIVLQTNQPLTTNIELQLYNLQGKRIKNEKINPESGRSNYTISTKNISDGSYILVVKYGNERKIARFLKNIYRSPFRNELRIKLF